MIKDVLSIINLSQESEKDSMTMRIMMERSVATTPSMNSIILNTIMVMKNNLHQNKLRSTKSKQRQMITAPMVSLVC